MKIDQTAAAGDRSSRAAAIHHNPRTFPESLRFTGAHS
jgi:hypothetical protein